MFVMRLSHSGRAFHAVFATQAQGAFLEGHVLAFEYFSAVPGRVRPYDNLGSAVVRVLKGRDRAEAERFIALRSHYPSTRSSASLARPGRTRRRCGRRGRPVRDAAFCNASLKGLCSSSWLP
jgi:hypothetical protein